MPGRKSHVKLTPEQQKFLEEIERKRQQTLAVIRRIPIAALIWGPSPANKSNTGEVRRLLKEVLLENGHLAHFSEELIDKNLPQSIVIQQVSHVEAYDITFSIPDSTGSIAEIHDFARIPNISHKIVTYLDQKWNKGYSNQSLIQLQSNATCRIVPYEARELPNCIINHALGLVMRLQEFYFLAGRRG